MPVVKLPLSKGLGIRLDDADWIDLLPVNMLAVHSPVLEAAGYMHSWAGTSIISKLSPTPNVINEDLLQSVGAIYNTYRNSEFRLQTNGDFSALFEINSAENNETIIPTYRHVANLLDPNKSFYTPMSFSDRSVVFINRQKELVYFSYDPAPVNGSEYVINWSQVTGTIVTGFPAPAPYDPEDGTFSITFLLSSVVTERQWFLSNASQTVGLYLEADTTIPTTTNIYLLTIPSGIPIMIQQIKEENYNQNALLEGNQSLAFAPQINIVGSLFRSKDRIFSMSFGTKGTDVYYNYVFQTNSFELPKITRIDHRAEPYHPETNLLIESKRIDLTQSTNQTGAIWELVIPNNESQNETIRPLRRLRDWVKNEYSKDTDTSNPDHAGVKQSVWVPNLFFDNALGILPKGGIIQTDIRIIKPIAGSIITFDIYLENTQFNVNPPFDPNIPVTRDLLQESGIRPLSTGNNGLGYVGIYLAGFQVYVIYDNDGEHVELVNTPDLIAKKYNSVRIVTTMDFEADLLLLNIGFKGTEEFINFQVNQDYIYPLIRFQDFKPLDEELINNGNLGNSKITSFGLNPDEGLDKWRKSIVLDRQLIPKISVSDRTEYANPSNPDDPIFHDIIDVTRNQSQYIFLRENSQDFGITDLNQQFGEEHPDYEVPFYDASERHSGYVVACRVWHGLVVIFSRHAITYHQQSGNAANQYIRVPSLTCQAGALSASTVCEFLDSFVVLGSPFNETPSIYFISQGRYQELSDRLIQQYLRNYTEFELINTYIEPYKFDSHDGFLVHLPKNVINPDGLTLVYTSYGKSGDHTSGSLGQPSPWSIISTGNDTFEIPLPNYRGIHHIYNDNVGKITVGSKTSNDIAIIDHSISTHFGQTSVFTLYTPLVQLRNVKLFDFDIDRAVNFNTSNVVKSGSLSTTFDGVNYQKSESFVFNPPSDLTQRILVRNLGYSRNNIGFKLDFITNKPISISNFRIRVEK